MRASRRRVHVGGVGDSPHHRRATLGSLSQRERGQRGRGRKAGTMFQPTEEFVRKARAVWGDQYDYSQTEYQGPQRPVTIICSIHGPFQQLPYNHLSGHKCCQCRNDARRMTQVKFVERAKALFGDYDYSQVRYQSAMVKVTIVCPKHGPFERRPSSLLAGRGCPQCCAKPRPKRGPQFKWARWEIELMREVLREYRARMLERNLSKTLIQRASW
jgi:hypothetical protein